MPAEKKHKAIDKLLEQAREDGMQAMMIYCNTLSGSLGMEYLFKKHIIPVVHPMMAYPKYAEEYKVVGLLGGGIQGPAAVETVMLNANDKCKVLGVCNQLLVEAIDVGLSADEIMEKFDMVSLMRYLESCGCESIILVCTHFPYLMEELVKCTKLPILDPTELMYEMLLETS